MLCRQVGASRHFHVKVHGYRNARFPNSWEDRAGLLTSWPFRSFDLVPLDVYVWEFVTDKYFIGLPTNIYDLWPWIAGAVVEVTPGLLRRSSEGSDYRWDICGAASGSHIIQYFWHITRNLMCFATFICTLLLSASFSKCLYPIKVIKIRVLLKHAVFRGTQIMLQWLVTVPDGFTSRAGYNTSCKPVSHLKIPILSSLPLNVSKQKIEPVKLFLQLH
jgi:hypothetical protein